MSNFINFSANKIIISNKSSENFLKLVEDLGISYILTKDNEKFNKNYNDHPDISLFYYNDHIFVDENVFDYYESKIEIKGLIKVNSKFERQLNMNYNSNYFFHNEKFKIDKIYELLKKDKDFCHIEQGYSNCSMICFENSIITTDFGIYKSLKSKFDVILIKSQGIKLTGYENGFIGGTCGFVSENKLLFYSDVTKYVDCGIIKDIAKDNNVEIIYPKSEFFEDLGSIISIK